MDTVFVCRRLTIYDEMAIRDYVLVTILIWMNMFVWWFREQTVFCTKLRCTRGWHLVNRYHSTGELCVIFHPDIRNKPSNKHTCTFCLIKRYFNKCYNEKNLYLTEYSNILYISEIYGFSSQLFILTSNCFPPFNKCNFCYNQRHTISRCYICHL